MMRLPEDIFAECANLMGGKRFDYTTEGVHENFERSALVSSWFKDGKDKVYITLIATKLARLANLLGSKSPRNESIRDSFKDLINYSALWADSRDERDDAAMDSNQTYTELNSPSYQVDPKIQELGEKIDGSVNAANKIMTLAEELTDTHLIRLADEFYKMKARRNHHKF